MKKLFFILIILSSLILVSCKKENHNYVVSEYNNVVLNKTDDDLINAVSLVEDACVTLGVEHEIRRGFFTIPSCSTQSAVIYKNVGDTYYAVTYYDSDVLGKTDAYNYTIRYSADDYISNVEFYGYDKYNEIAVFTFTSSTPLHVAEITTEVEQADMIFTIASTRASRLKNLQTAYDYESNTGRLYSGLISRTGIRTCTHTAMSSENDFGSGLFNYDGHLVGINVDKVSNVTGSNTNVFALNYALYGEYLLDVLNDIENNTSYTKSVQRIEPEGLGYKTVIANDYSDFPEGVNCGLLINATISLFPELRTGDLVGFINDIPASSIDVLKDICKLTLSTEKIHLTVYREASDDTYRILDITN